MIDILVVTTNEVARARIARVIGAVFGTSIRSRSALGNAFGGMRATFGGNQPGYTTSSKPRQAATRPRPTTPFFRASAAAARMASDSTRL